MIVGVRALGLCGTDLHIFGGRGDTYPWIVGHDATGVVHALGSGVDNLELGQRVVVDPVLHCGDCAACQSGATQLCPTGGYLGMLGPGMAAEYVAVPARLVIPITDGVSDLAATALEPVAVALHTMKRIAPFAGALESAIIVGGGPLGLLQAQVMGSRGWSCVVVEPRAHRREIGEELGVATVDPSDAEALASGNGPRLIVETSAAGAGVDLAERLAPPGSVIAVVGRGPHSISPPSLLLKELTVLGIKGGPGAYPEAVDLVASNIVDTAAVVTHSFAWEDAPQAFATSVDEPETVLRSALVGSW
ncbi:alcohol dehydrogenase catalytic domain-containing protein [Nocardia sp. R7R-8]|uniref:alcohol dehydrogenase catalytic domain-containing protein n=1 Tax=Nocardia sp. R7R-8 TaxID=3459304 RepID=UPI00403DACB8